MKTATLIQPNIPTGSPFIAIFSLSPHELDTITMTHDDKVNGASKTAAEPPLRDFQEQANANAELEEAINAIPVKDYSDFEITLETKDHYEDALFSDDASLELALTAPRKTITQEQPSNHESPSTEATQSVTEIDYSIFLSEKTRQGLSSAKPAVELPVQQHKTLNNCPVSDKTPLTIIQHTQTNTQLEQAYETSPPDEPEDSGIHHKILRWGKQSLSSNRAQLDEYLGRSLPERLLPLDFKFPTLKPKKEFDSVVGSYEIEKLMSSKGRLLHTLLKQADEELAVIAKCQLSNKARLQLLEAYTPGLMAKIRAIKGTQGKSPPFPYEENRAIAAEHAQNVLKHLISSYKLVYSSLYESANHLYAPRRKTANKLAFRIIDLLGLEQNLLNSLHKPLPAGSAKTFNKLFHALARYEPESLDTPMTSLALEQETTITKLFLRYQALLSFDLATLSATLYKQLNQYLATNLELLEVLPPRDWNTPAPFSGKAWMVSHDNNNAPVLASTAGSDPFTPIFIRVDNFFNQIKSDYAECLQLLGTSQATHSSSALQPMARYHSLPLMCELNRYIQLIESNSEPQSYSNFQPWPCKVYSGFAGSHGWLNHYYAKLNQPVRKQGEAPVELPKMPRPGTTDWRCAMEDENHLYLQTAERKGTAPLDVGHLLLVLRSDGELSNDIQLLIISRIERIQAGSINLTAEKIGRQSVNVLIKNAAGEKTRGIITCFNNLHFLVASPAEKFMIGSTFEATLPNLSTGIMQVKSHKYLSQQCQVLELE